MNGLSIYLSGNISPDPRTHEWRSTFKTLLRNSVAAGEAGNINIINPCENLFNQELARLAVEDPLVYMVARTSSQDILPKKDRRLMEKADIMVVNLELADPEKPPIGTTHELCWAADTPGLSVIAITGSKPSIWYTHPFNRRCINYTCVTVEEAVRTVCKFFVNPRYVLETPYAT